MTLLQIIQITGFSLIVLGGLYLWNGKLVGTVCKSFPRSKLASYICMGAASCWVLWHISNLGQSDFGDYKQYIFIFFAGIGLLSFHYVPDFLAVRGASILALLAARVILDVAWLQYSTGQCLLNIFTYVAIVMALYLGAAPYKLRDFFNWLFTTPIRPRILGTILLGYGLILILSSANL